MDECKTEYAYTQQCLDVLLQQEDILQYEHFGSAEALALGNAASKLASEYGRGIGLRITRESDGLILLQYMMDDKAARNLDFMEGKRQAALLSGHCSLWPFVEHAVCGKWQELFDSMPGTLPYGGAFPIRVNGEWTATIAVSGLHDGKDHELLICTLSSILGQSVPSFPGALV